MADAVTFKMIYRPGALKDGKWTPGTWGDYVDTTDTTRVTAYQRRAVVTFLSAVFRVTKAEVIEAHPAVGEELGRGDLADMFRSANCVSAAIPW